MFKPAGYRGRELEQVVMTLDEFEAVRLSDLEGLYQEDAASRMGVSRATFGRILEAAHNKVARVLIHGKALVIEGGTVRVVGRNHENEGSRRRRGTQKDLTITSERQNKECRNENMYTRRKRRRTTE
jgi:predicted DNA-binding protein (UPF0251 family)